MNPVEPAGDAGIGTTRNEPAGAVFWTSVGVGWLLIGWGIWLVLSRAAETRPLNFATFFLGLALAHDLVLAPVVMGVGVALRRRAPAVAAGAIAAGLIASAIVVAYAIPLWLDRAAKTAQNPSFLPRDPVVGVAIVLALTWTVVGTIVLRRVVQAKPR